MRQPARDCFLNACSEDFVNFFVNLENAPVRGVAANNSGPATGVLKEMILSHPNN